MGVPRFWKNKLEEIEKIIVTKVLKGESSNKHFTNTNDEMRHLKISEIVTLKEKEIEPIFQ